MYNSLSVLAAVLTKLIDTKSNGSKVDFSKITGIDRSAIDLYIKRLTKPKIDVLDKIARAVNMKPWQIIQPEEDKSLIEKLIPFDIIDQLAKLAPEKREEVYSALRGVLKLAGDQNNDSDKKKASG